VDERNGRAAAAAAAAAATATTAGYAREISNVGRPAVPEEQGQRAMMEFQTIAWLEDDDLGKLHP
jgi:hypothetical protein